MTTAETWRPIPGIDGYEASDQGRIRTLRRGRSLVLKAQPDGRGYHRVSLVMGSRNVGRRVHSLVALAFIGPRPSGLEVRHLNGHQLDNRAANLAYGTHTENEQDKADHGTHHNAVKTECPANHPYDDANTLIKGDGKRRCRACLKAQRDATKDARREYDRQRYLATKATER